MRRRHLQKRNWSEGRVRAGQGAPGLSARAVEGGRTGEAPVSHTPPLTGFLPGPVS